MKKILVIGSVALDTITTPTGSSKEVLGGSATYFSISASFFTQVNLVATVGRDFPDKHRSLIRSFGVDIKGLEAKEGRTFRWEGSYVDDLNCAKTIETQLNVFADFRPKIPEGYKNSRFIFLANIDPDLQLFILKQFKDNRFIGCDSMNYWIQNKGPALKRLMKKATFVFLNDAEARLFSGESNIMKAGKYLLSLGPRFAIIKRGEYGAMLFSKDKALLLTPAYLLETVCDPTGAGDTFAGGFMGYLARSEKIDDMTVRRALLHGSVMASFTVEDFSVNRFLKLKKKDIERRYDSFRKLTMA
ncbi:MAG: sugar kinase [Candidatus Omnitrophica bacterium]|nr:sugar kinase [Candidatus Omnitrophota bacterium]MBU4149924.1 sugar kinase [Candidatus Omnitrophota bacterium]